MLTHDALKLICDDAVAASRGRVAEIPEETPGYRPFIDGLGALQFIKLPVVPRRHGLATVDSLCDYAGGLKKTDSAVVWVSESGITLIPNDDDRVDTVTLPLRLSPQIQTLRDRAASPHPQAPFIKMLRIDLANTHEHTSLLEEVRSVKFTGATEVRGEIQKGRESMGRSIESEIKSANQVPDEVTLQVRVFDCADFTSSYPVSCAVDVLIQEERFRLVALPMSIDNAIASALSDLQSRIVEKLPKGVRVYRGTP